MIYKNYKELYKNPEEYNKIFTGSSNYEIKFYKDYLKKAKSVLYLGSGSGRLLKQFLKVNKNITGVEISKEMVSYSKKLLKNIKIINNNVLNLKLRQKFDLILAPYRFICHLNKKELEKLFKVVNYHLKDKGLFVGDIFSPYLPHDRSIKCEINGIDIQGNFIDKVYNVYEHDKQLCYEVVERFNIKTKEYGFIKVKWNYYYPEQLKQIGNKFSLKCINIYGSFKKEKLDKVSDDLIFVFEKSSK